MTFFENVKKSLANKKAANKKAGGTKQLNPYVGADYTAVSGFNRGLLPNPESFYQAVFAGLPMKKTSKGWQVCCPFHQDKRPSAVAFFDGGFCCFACGVYCGDVLDFYCQQHKVGFKDGARALGAWRDKQ